MAPYRSLLLVPGLAACGAGLACSGANSNEYGQAAVALAYNVPAAVINREVTGECYGNCSYGSECDHATGLCVPITERQPANAPSTAPTLEERCTWAERDWAANGTSLGEKHPDMLGLRRVIDRCGELRRDPDTARVAACGTRELDLVELEGKGFGSRHPEVVAAQGSLQDCLDASKARPTPSLVREVLTPAPLGTAPR